MRLEAVRKGEGLEVGNAVFSADGRHIATVRTDKVAQMWDPTTGAQQLKFPGHVWRAAFSPDGSRIATVLRAPAQTTQIWDVRGTLLHTLRGHEAPPTDVAFSPDGRHVITGSFDKTARMWNAATGQEERVLRGHNHVVTAVAFGPDGFWVATSSLDKTTRIWNAATGTQVHVLKGHQGIVLSLSFSVDGRYMLTTSSDNTARIWNVATGKEAHVLEGHQDNVNTASFNAEGTQVVTTSDDHTVRVWDVATGTEMDGFHPDSPAVTARFVGDKLQLVHEDFTVSLVTLSVRLNQLPGFAAFEREMTQKDVLQALINTNPSVHCSHLPNMTTYMRCEKVGLGTGLQGTVDFGFGEEQLRHVHAYVTEPDGERQDTKRTKTAIAAQLSWLASADTVSLQGGSPATVENVLHALTSQDRVALVTQKGPALVGSVRKTGERIFVEMTYTLPSPSVASR